MKGSGTVKKATIGLLPQSRVTTALLLKVSSMCLRAMSSDPPLVGGRHFPAIVITNSAIRRLTRRWSPNADGRARLLVESVRVYLCFLAA